MSKLIGFIGQGWIGKNYADDFEERGFEVVRYSQESGHAANKDRIAKCDIVFVAVPTPTTPKGFDDSILIEVLALVGKGKVAVIKSTVLPQTTDDLQARYPDIFVMHSPEFLRAANAAYDARHPERNIIGITEQSKHLAHDVLNVLPKAPYHLITDARTAVLIKYGGNCQFYAKVLFVNTLYDVCQRQGVDYAQVRDAMAADPRIGKDFLDVVHEGGRGAGGFCFIKDFAAYRALYEGATGADKAVEMLKAMEFYNIELLKNSAKSTDLLTGVYGEELIPQNPPIASS